MDNIIFRDLIQMVNFFRDCDKEIGRGGEGTCFRKGNVNYKLYNYMQCYLFNNPSEKKKLLRFRDIVIDNIYFIRCLLFLREDLIGVGIDYAPGVNCQETYLHRRNLNRIINALSILKKNVYELSSYGIYINDSDLENILYDGKAFSLIDTTNYYLLGDIKDKSNGMDDINTIYRKNMTVIMQCLFKRITNANTLRDNFILAYLCEINSEYKDYLVDTDLMINPDETIIGIRDTIQEGIGREIITLSSCRNDLLKIRKM